MKTGIIGALPEEIQFLLQELRHSGKKVTETRRGSMEFTEGEIRNNAVVVCRCGVGKVHAAMCAQILISEFGVTRIINTGAAGALDSRLSLFDIVVSTEAVQHDFNVTPFGYEPACIPGFNSPFFVADPDLREVAKKGFERVLANFPGGAPTPALYEGRIATGDVFVAEKSLRAEIVERFFPACVEMEGAAIAQVCATFGIPFVILRSISDLADNSADSTYDEYSEKVSVMSAMLIVEMLALLDT